MRTRALIEIPLARPVPRPGQAGPCTGASGALCTLRLQLQRRIPFWRAMANNGARSRRPPLRGSEFRRELKAHFDVEELNGIRNIPARTIAGGFRRLGPGAAGDRLLRYMLERGYAAGFLIDSTPLADVVVFFWQAKCHPRRAEPSLSGGP